MNGNIILLFLLFFSCLHEWEPHDGESVTTLFFCDDLLIADDSSPFWRYLITGSHYNTVLKIWCAVKWKCIQTIEYVLNSTVTYCFCLFLSTILDNCL